MSPPLLSVVAINWNAQDYIVECLKSVLNSDYKDLEIILVDNASEDKSVVLARELASLNGQPEVKIIANDKNYGAAYALNQGADIAKGKYISFLATDTRVEKNCFSELIRILESDAAIGAASCKLLMMNEPQRFDSAGEYLSQFGLLIQRHAGCEIDKGQFDHVEEIFSVKGTALTVRGDCFRKAGKFPEDYFMFLEETDLCWRIWLSGYKIIFAPGARIYHASGVSVKSHKRKDYLVKYYGSRNYISTLFKNLGTRKLIEILPIHVLLWFLLAVWLSVNLRMKEGFYIIKAILWNTVNFKKILINRKEIQSRRLISDKQLMPKIMRKINLSYLFARVGMW